MENVDISIQENIQKEIGLSAITISNFFNKSTFEKCILVRKCNLILIHYIYIKIYVL